MQTQLFPTDLGSQNYLWPFSWEIQLGIDSSWPVRPHAPRPASKMRKQVTDLLLANHIFLLSLISFSFPLLSLYLPLLSLSLPPSLQCLAWWMERSAHQMICPQMQSAPSQENWYWKCPHLQSRRIKAMAGPQTKPVQTQLPTCTILLWRIHYFNIREHLTQETKISRNNVSTSHDSIIARHSQEEELGICLVEIC